MANKISKGVSFCQVKRMEAENQLREEIVEGNHWYIGAIPALVIRAITINIGDKLFQGVVQTAGARRNRIDPVAWAMKYLQAALVLSVVGPREWNVIKGTKDKRFISIPSQAISQLGAVREVIVPRIKEAENKIEEIGIIKEETGSYGGGLNPMQFSATFMGKEYLFKCSITLLE